MTPLTRGSTIGIIGGGQLGRMLSIAAARLGFEVTVLDPSEQAPAVAVSSGHLCAAFDDPEALKQLADVCDVVTYEFENVPADGLADLDVPVFPPVGALRTSQDRLTEKEFLRSIDIPTAPYEVVNSSADIAAAIDTLGDIIVKTRRLGYDGKGQQRFGESETVADNAFDSFGTPCIAEGMIDFVSEISVIATRGQDGSFAAFEPGRNLHTDGILSTTHVPSGVSSDTVAQALELAQRLADQLDYVGTLGLELFVLEDGTLLANEFAPRVHNSGHWTEAGAATSQFEQHIRAVTGVALGAPSRHSNAVMYNLIGDEITHADAWLYEANALLHDYAKADIRAGRKMGHVTVLAPLGSETATPTLDTINLDLPGHYSGKVRETYTLPDQQRLMVTTDRLSALDRIIGRVPHKGQVLNQLAAWWFAQTSDIVGNHVVSVPDPNALIALDAETLPIEVVVRARLTGSTSTSVLPRYLDGERDMYGHTLPDGLTPHGPLPQPLITPTTKAADGEHDQPVAIDEVVSLGLLTAERWQEVQEVALALFARGTEIAEAAGFILADTKYEFGLNAAGELIVIDEIHTPDSSRYWNASTAEARIAEGLAPEGFDKEPVRIALGELGYKGDGEPPQLPEKIWDETSRRYVEVFERLTGTPFVPGAQPASVRIRSNLAGLLR